MNKKNIKFFFLVLLGLFFILYFFYIRLIMHRNMLFFTYNMQILYLCCIFIFFNLLHSWILEFVDFFYEIWVEEKKPSSSKFIKILNILKAYILMPFNAVYELLKKWHYFEPVLFKLIILNYWFSPNYRVPYIIFNLIPRIMVILALFIDIQKGYIYTFYYALPLLIFGLLYNIILKKAKEIFLERLDHFANTLFNFYWVFEEPFNVLVALVKINLDFNKVFFKYYEDIALNEKSHDFLCLWRLIYMAVVFLTIYSYLPYNDPFLYNISRVLHFILAMEWWYILFHILLNK